MLNRLIFLFSFGAVFWPSYGGVKLGGLPLVNPQRIVLVLIAGIFIYRVLGSRRDAKVVVDACRYHSYLLMPLLFFFFWRLISAFFSKDVAYSTFLVGLDIVSQCVLFFSVYLAIVDERSVVKVVRLMFYGFLFVVGVGVVESLVESNLYLSFVPESAMQQDYIVSAVTEKIRDSYRVQASFLHPLVLAEYLTIFLPLVFFVTAGRIYGRLSYLFAFSGLVFGVYVLYRTGSRSGVVCLGVQLLVYMYYRFCRDLNSLKRPMSFLRVVVILVAVIASAPFAVDEFQNVLLGANESESMSTLARLSQIEDGLVAIEESPLVGWGVGMAVNYASTENEKTKEQSVDNYYLTVVVDSGVPALIALFILLYRHFAEGRRLSKVVKGRLGVLAGMLSYSVVGLASFNFILSSYEIFPIFFIFLALVLRVREMNRLVRKNMAPSPSLLRKVEAVG
ncbi:O-antigen ligase family protein [Zoogloea sp.]|uniref:O-antigen ligase family protein n=1 Tax=Zoogloea sp. TaxID=49181 RepID=UPI0031FD525C